MSIKNNKVSLLTALIMGASAVSFSTNALAVSCSGADAGNATVTAFKNDPSSVLNNADLASAIQLIAVTDSNLLSDIIATARIASADQQSAIGKGLGQAASACVTDQAAYAAEIQTEAEGVGGALETAFTDASDADDAEPGDPTETAAVGTPGNQTITPTGDTGTGTAVVGGTDNNGSGSGTGNTTGPSNANNSSPGSSSPSFSGTGAASSNARNVSPST